MRCLMIVLLMATVGSAAEIRRFYGEFPIGGLVIRTQAFDGGQGGSFFVTSDELYAQAVVWVEEGQNFAWEWVGITPPTEWTSFEWPNLTFSAEAYPSAESNGVPMDLNPVSPNVWSGTENHTIPMDGEIHLTGTYESFSHVVDFQTDLRNRNASVGLGACASTIRGIPKRSGPTPAFRCFRYTFKLPGGRRSKLFLSHVSSYKACTPVASVHRNALLRLWSILCR